MCFNLFANIFFIAISFADFEVQFFFLISRITIFCASQCVFVVQFDFQAFGHTLDSLREEFLWNDISVHVLQGNNLS